MPTSTKANSAARLHQKALTLPGANPVSLVSFGLLNTSTGALGAYIDASGFLVGPTGSPLASSNDYKDSVRLASTAALAAVTYDNSAGTLTANAVGALSVDSVATALGDRLLIKNQASDLQNGIYTVTTLGTAGVAFVLTRATDFDLWTEMPGAVVSVEVGTVNAGTQWVCNVAAGGTLGTTAITFVVPKNYVDLTTNQTIAGTKTFGTVVVTTLNGNAVTTGTGTLTLSTYTLTATASGNIYVSGGTDVEVSDGGTGRSTGTTAYALVATGTTATGAQQTLASGATTQVLVGGGASALPVWTTATGSGAPVRATSPTLVTPALGTPSSGTLTNCTGLPQNSVSGLTTADSPMFGGVNVGHATDTTLARVSAGVLSVEGVQLATQVDLYSEKITWSREEFSGGTNTDGQIGQLGWRTGNIGGTGGSGAYVIAEANHPGLYAITTAAVYAASVSDARGIWLGGSGVTPFTTLDSPQEWRFSFQLAAITNVAIKIGLVNDNATFTPTRGEYLSFDTSLGTPDTNWMGVTVDGGAETRTSTGVAAGTGWFTVKMRYISNLSIGFSLSSVGGAFSTEVIVAQTNAAGGVFRYPVFYVANKAAAAKTLTADFASWLATVTR